MSANQYRHAQYQTAAKTAGKPGRTARAKAAFLLTFGLITLSTLTACAGDQQQLASAISASYHTNFSTPASADQISSVK